MKLAWTLIILGGLLVLDGTIRIGLAVMYSNIWLAVGGILTGWLLGGWLLRKGLRRRADFVSRSKE